jgi:DNA-binding transcriptional LysR family regulator
MTNSWDLYRSFLAVVQQGSLSGAARALGAAQPTIGRHINALEQALGGPLFTRSPGGLQPTALAMALLPHAKTMEAAVAAIERTAFSTGGEDVGSVRITASEIIGAEVLPPILTEMRERRPGIAFELTLTNTPEDLLRRDADIAVRMFRPTQDALIARRIGDVAIGLFARHDYLQKHGTPQSPEELARHIGIGQDRDERAIRVMEQLGVPIKRENFAFRSDSDLAQLAALRAGFGIGVCQLPIARRHPELTSVLPEQILFKLELWLVMHEDLRQSKSVRRTYDELAAGLADYLSRK